MELLMEICRKLQSILNLLYVRVAVQFIYPELLKINSNVTKGD